GIQDIRSGAETSKTVARKSDRTAASECGVRREEREVSVVHHVVDLPAELNAHALGDFGELSEVHVPLLEATHAEAIPPAGSERAGSRECEGRRGVRDEQVGITEIVMRREDTIRSLDRVVLSRIVVGTAKDRSPGSPGLG